MNKDARHGVARHRVATSEATARGGEIPERGLKIGEAARAIGVETYVLRFWETQFAVLKPRHSKTKHRFYHQRDLEVLALIKRLLHQEGFTIVGANKHIREQGIDALLSGKPLSREVARAPSPADRQAPAPGAGARHVIADVRRDLESIQKLLKQ
ncbi:MAG TPA: MerR family transcriptional regulator [Candidatus Binataceae bacterium]|nr:MerR family transcriptional regulator [Candidatus Binataceae bacterium]